MPAGSDNAKGRHGRLAEALRANLARRKQQARQRSAEAGLREAKANPAAEHAAPVDEATAGTLSPQRPGKRGE